MHHLNYMGPKVRARLLVNQRRRETAFVRKVKTAMPGYKWQFIFTLNTDDMTAIGTRSIGHGEIGKREIVCHGLQHEKL